MAKQTDMFMRDTDAFSWYLEKDPGLRSTIVAIAWLDERPDFDVLASRLDRATRLAPRFRQRPVQAPGRLATPRWVDTDFDLSMHLRRIESPKPHTPATVIDFARIEAMSGFDRSRPLWQFTLVEHLVGGRAALVMKVHHSLTDGIGGMQLAFLLFETTDAADPGDEVPVPRSDEKALSPVELVRESLAHNRQQFFETVRHGLSGALPAAVHLARNPLHSTSEMVATVRSIGRFVAPVPDTLSQVMTARSLDRHLDMIAVDLDDLKHAARSAGGTLNDGFVAAVTGGLRRYHEHHGSKVGDLRITLPISIRKEGDPAESNRITLERFKLPAGVADPAERIRLSGERCREARNDRALPMTNAIAGALNLLPSAVVGSMLKHIDFLASNVPGVNVPIFLGGAPVSGYYAFGPTTGSAVNVTLLTYNGTCCVGFTVDTAAVPDHDVLMECFREGFEEVLELGGEHHPVARPLQHGHARQHGHVSASPSRSRHAVAV
ncbi:MAG: wax ester/triacylglycerol synthase domain-containing protein [Acidimicrobiales bacterium]